MAELVFGSAVRIDRALFMLQISNATWRMSSRGAFALNRIQTENASGVLRSRVPFAFCYIAVSAGILWLLIAERSSAGAPPPTQIESGATNLLAAADSKFLFDGKTLKGWKVTDFAGHGDVTVDSKFLQAPAVILEMGALMTGLTWTNEPPKGDYEVSLEAMKIDGSDFFCALTFPAGGGHCSLIVGGGGGGLVGISSIDGMDASENETTKFLSFEKNRWYGIRVRVTHSKIEAWIDQERVVNLATTDRKLTVRAGEIELNEPFGLAAYQTKSALRNIRLRNLAH